MGVISSKRRLQCIEKLRQLQLTMLNFLHRTTVTHSGSARKRPSSPVHCAASMAAAAAAAVAAASAIHERNALVQSGARDRHRQAALAKQLEPCKEWLVAHLWSSGLVASLVQLTKTLLPAVDASCQKNSAVGCHARAQMALRQLHSLDKQMEHTDQLMVIFRYLVV